jgi:hypothetical protein
LIVIDSSGWLEFFGEGPHAKEFANRLLRFRLELQHRRAEIILVLEKRSGLTAGKLCFPA